MRKLLLLLFFLGTVLAKAQTWCPTGATWHHTMIPTFFQPGLNMKGVFKDQYIADTLIQSKICKIITGTFEGFIIPSTTPTVLPNRRRSYSHLENGVLYVWTGNAFDTVVNFNAAIGDKWLRNRIMNAMCNNRVPVTVIDTNHIQVGNFNLKRIVTTYTNSFTMNNSTYTVSITDEIIERIMTTNKYIYPVYCEIDNITDFYLYNGELICYEDEKFSQYKRSGFTECDFITGVGEIDPNAAIRIFPNPTFNSLRVTLPTAGDYRVEITDATGRIVKTAKLSEQQQDIPLAELKNGIYFVKISDADRTVLTQKIVKD